MKKGVAGAVALAVVLAGCESNSSMGTMASGLGGIFGGVLGNQACKNQDSTVRAACTAAGAVVGVITADALYKKLTEADRKRMDEQTARALAQDSAQSSPRAWSSPETGVNCTVAVKEETTQEVAVQVPILKGPVTTPPPLVLIGQEYEVTASRLNIRGGPGTDYATIEAPLNKGTVIDVLAKVEEKPEWMLFSRDGVGSGYVHADNLQATGRIVGAKTNAPTVATNSVPVQVKQQCKVIEQTAAFPSGETDKATSRMCQQSDGSWRMVS